MRVISYKRSEFLMPWKWHKRNPLERFILDIPYALYFSIVPSRDAINEVLKRGKAGGGMGGGVTWRPMEVTAEEYDAILQAWRDFDLRKVLRIKKQDIPDLGFVFDEEIMAIPRHLAYLKRSREKYQDRFRKKVHLS